MDFLKCSVPGYENFTVEFGTLASTYPPPFIYIQDIQALRTTLNAVDAILRDISNSNASMLHRSKVYYAKVDCISCFTPRLFYEAAINSLVGWEPDWEEGCSNWAADGVVGAKWNENMDMFLHGLRAAHQYLCRQSGIGISESQGQPRKTPKGKGKAKEVPEVGFDGVRFIIVVERVERLKESQPEMIVPLTRLAELVCRVFSSSFGAWQPMFNSFLFVGQD